MDTDTNTNLKRKETEDNGDTKDGGAGEGGDLKRMKQTGIEENEEATTTTSTTSTTSTVVSTTSNTSKDNNDNTSNETKKKTNYFKGKFIYGNYKNYYKYRHDKADQEDLRFQVLGKDLFKGKRCLDIGCNSGVVTLKIACDFEPSYIKGVDIDLDLIKIANASLRNERIKLFNEKNGIPNNNNNNNNNTNQSKKEEEEKEKEEEKKDVEMKEIDKEITTTASTTSTTSTTPTISNEPFIPISFKFIKMDKKEVEKKPFAQQQNNYKEMNRKLQGQGYLTNIGFYQQNFLEDHKFDTEGSYDVIMALSITKWVHLNWGDQGIKDFFKKIYKLLSKGGVFIMEPQKFRGYSKRKGLSKEMIETYNTIRFKPEEFTDYLINQVGFKSCEELQAVQGVKAKGFQRSLFKLIK
ncbi:hypothetical protein DFA_01767 [Cavenderia fasciculata]|uniref:RNA methyltransferase n=1 Tax=Cavenderia fasciculata TaxID=261658 RepID=F4PUL7_CACFS|nr:uncharacterized protein DFA_01767 [Cavenderia fasciculata]EGG21881.1 hypothetical protein DFA_01767 [Cavenderia fasciculata]|eukprot:XP_004359732.1 hypothetical protein DFA_01767 [Cavenderia fasciculata]